MKPADRRIIVGGPVAGDNTIAPLVSTPRSTLGTNPFQTPDTPNAPSVLDLQPFAQGGEIWVIASWTPGSVNSAGAIVQWAVEVTKEGETVPFVFTPSAGSAPPFKIPNLEPNTSYHVSVTAITAAGGASTPLEGDVATGHDDTVLAAPTGLAGARTYKGLVASWTAMGTTLDPFTGHYVVTIAEDSGFTVNVQTKNTGTSAVVSFGGLTPEIPYYIKVRAVSSSGIDGRDSDPVTLNIGGVVASDITAGTIGADVAYIGDLTADQITTGDLNASGTVNIRNLNATEITAGTLNFDRLQGGTLGAYLIILQGGGIIRSSNWVNLTSGWRIDGAGTLQANNLVAYGTITTTSGSLNIQIGSQGVNEITFNAADQTARGFIQHGTSGYMSIQAPTTSGHSPGVINMLDDVLSLDCGGTGIVVRPTRIDVFKDLLLGSVQLTGNFDGTTAPAIRMRSGNTATWSWDGTYLKFYVDTTMVFKVNGNGLTVTPV